MRQKTLTAIALALVLTASGVWADDLTGADRLLCTAVQATKCVMTVLASAASTAPIW